MSFNIFDAVGQAFQQLPPPPPQPQPQPEYYAPPPPPPPNFDFANIFGNVGNLYEQLPDLPDPGPDYSQEFNLFSQPTPQPQPIDYQSVFNDFANYMNPAQPLPSLPTPQASQQDWGNFYGNFANAAFTNMARDDEPEKDFWYWLGNDLPSGIMTGLSAPFVWAGEGVGAAADSNIPGLSQLAGAARFGYQTVGEPLLDFTTSAVGDISQGRMPGVIEGVYRSAFDRDNYQRELTDTKVKMVQEAYNQALAQGKSPEEAAVIAQRADQTLNTANLAEYEGQQAFGELPAWVQLGVGLADPIGNKAFDLGFKPVAKGVGYTAGKVADATGLSDVGRAVGDTLGQALESPQAAANKFFRATEALDPALSDYVQRATEQGLIDSPITAFEQVLNPESPLYYGTLYANNPRLGQAIAETIQDVFAASQANLADATLKAQGKETAALDATRQANDFALEVQGQEAGTPQRLNELIEDSRTIRVEPNLNDQIADLEARAANPDFHPAVRERAALEAQQLRDQIANNAEFETFGQPRQYAELSTPAAAAAAATTDPVLQAARPDITARQSSTIDRAINQPQKYAAARPEYLTQARFKAPDLQTAKVTDIMESLNQAYRLKVKADVIDAKSGAVRPARLFEQYGAAGTAMRRTLAPFHATGRVMSRLYLATPSRLVRDTASNLLKLAMDGRGVLRQRKVNQRFETSGGKLPANFGGGASRDVQGLKDKPDGMVKRAAYLVAIGPSELANMALDKATGGKVRDFNQLTELSEGKIKGEYYKRAYNRAYDQAVKDLLNQPAIKSDPTLARYMQGQTALADFIAGKMPEGANLTDFVTNTYNPANLSPSVMALKDAVENTPFSGISDILDTLPDKWQEYAARQKKQSYGFIKDPTKRARMEAAWDDFNSLKDVGPEHPIFIGLRDAGGNLIMERGKPVMPGIFEEIRQHIDNVYDTLVIEEAARIKTLTKGLEPQVEQLVQYASRERGLAALQQHIALQQTKLEAQYTEQFKTDVVDRLWEKKNKAHRRQQHIETGRAQREAKRTNAEEYERLKFEAYEKALQEQGPYSNIFTGLDTVPAVAKAIKDAEKYAPPMERLQANHAELLADYLVNGKRNSYNKLLKLVKSHEQYQSKEAMGKYARRKRWQALGHHEYRYNTDRIERKITDMVENFKRRNQSDYLIYPPQVDLPGMPKTEIADLPKPGAEERLTAYEKALYGGGARVNLPALKNMAARFGDKPAATRRKYVADILEADQVIREVTGNQFKLDPVSLEPVSQFDGQTLGQWLGAMQGRPDVAATYPTVPPPKLKKELPVDLSDALLRVDGILDEATRTKRFADMDKAEAETVISRVAHEILGVDPNDPYIQKQSLDSQRGAVDDFVNGLKEDLAARFEEGKQAGLTGFNQRKETAPLKEQGTQEAQALAQRMLELRAQAQARAGQEAYKTITNAFFDYSNKNVLDQVLDGLLPFQYWARQNFAYLARYFAAHPYHYAVILNFYKELEEENKKNGVPDYARNRIMLWKNPDGSQVMWDFNSLFAYTPGDTDSFMKVIDAGDPTAGQARNKLELGQVLFGYDKPGGQREKGILPAFFRPNPIIDNLTKTGWVNDFYRENFGVTDGFGAPGPSEQQTLGFLPGSRNWKELGAWAGATEWLRKQGIKIDDLDIEGPLNSFIFSRNAGKPLAAMNQELAGMVQRGEISKEAGLLAMASIKEGNYTPEALKALDRVQAERGPFRALSLVGLSTITTNTARQQEAARLRQGYQQADAAKDGGDKTAVSSFMKQNPGTSVLFAAGDKNTPDKIKQGVKDDRTRASIDQLYKDQKAGKVTSKEFNRQLQTLRGDNPGYGYFPDQAKADYNELNEQYRNIGGAEYDALTKLYNEYKEAGDKNAANAIYKSKQYQNVKAARDQFLKDNPEFAKQYQANIEAKYGPKETKPSQSPLPTRPATAKGRAYTSSTSSSPRKGATSSYSRTTTSRGRGTAAPTRRGSSSYAPTKARRPAAAAAAKPKPKADYASEFRRLTSWKPTSASARPVNPRSVPPGSKSVANKGNIRYTYNTNTNSKSYANRTYPKPKYAGGGNRPLPPPTPQGPALVAPVNYGKPKRKD